VLANQQLGDTLLIGIGVIHFGSKEKQDDIRILLNDAEVSKVREERAFVVSIPTVAQS
jgi:hypothetical protein